MLDLSRFDILVLAPKDDSVDLNLDTLKQEILEYLGKSGFAVFHSHPGGREGNAAATSLPPRPARCANRGRQRVPHALGFAASPRHCEDREDDRARRGLCSCAAPSLPC